MIKDIREEDLVLGDEVTVWFGDGNSGQGGILVAADCPGYVQLRTPGGTWTRHLDDVHHYTVDRPGAPEECLEFGNPRNPCEGPVEMWYAGHGYRHYPRCRKHGEARLNNRSELERYADSDVAPPGFREDDIGERWNDD